MIITTYLKIDFNPSLRVFFILIAGQVEVELIFLLFVILGMTVELIFLLFVILGMTILDLRERTFPAVLQLMFMTSMVRLVLMPW